MKKTGLTIVALVVFGLAASLAFAGGKNGEKDFDISVVEDAFRDGTISVQMKGKRAFSVGLTKRQNKNYQTVLLESCLPTKKKGFPEVGYFRMAFQLRDNRNYKLVVQKLTFDEMAYYGEWLPSRGQILRNMDPRKIPYQMGSEALVDADYPDREFVVLGEPFLIREVRGIDLTVYPVLVNTAMKRVKILQSITFELVPVEEGITVNQQPRGRLKILSQDKPVLESLFANFRWTGELDDGPGHMLVIYTSEYAAAIQPFIAHKESLGFTVAEQEVAKGTHVKSTIQNAYNADTDLLYVQLVGDWDDIRCDTIEGGPADNALGLVAGSDDYYDLIISRFSVESTADVTNQVNKVIAYETNPNQEWWRKGLGIASDEGAGIGDDDETDKEHVEIIKIYKLLPNGYTTVYDEYDPNASVSGVTSAVNGGVHVINYTGHGRVTAWVTTGYNINDVYALSNGEKLPIIFSTACVVGLYSYEEECFAEAWLRKQNGGAVSALMATINQPWVPPMRGQDYMNDLLTGGYDYATNPGTGISTSHGKTRVGSIAFNAFNLQIAEAGQDDVNTTKTWVLFGDGSLQVVGASPCPDCSGDERLVENITFQANSTCTCTGTTSLTLGEGIVVESGASVTFQAPLVRVTPGYNFKPVEGSSVEIRNK